MYYSSAYLTYPTAVDTEEEMEKIRVAVENICKIDHEKYNSTGSFFFFFGADGGGDGVCVCVCVGGGTLENKLPMWQNFPDANEK